MFASRLTSLRARLSARLARSLTLAGVAAAVLTSAACSSDSLVAPALTAQRATVGTSVLSAVNTTLARGLVRDVALPRDKSSFANIGAAGGSIEIKDAGFKLKIPAGAIANGSVKITVTAMAGSVVAYQFEPHGIVFAQPLTIEQSLDGTNWLKLPIKPVLFGGYFKDVSQVNLVTGQAVLNETFPILIGSNKASFDIRHFSGYMVSMD